MVYQTEAGPAPRKRSKGALTTGIFSMLAGVAGVILLVLGVIGLNQVPVPNLNGFNDGQTINVTDSGMSVYALEDVRETTVCEAVSGSNSTVFDRPVESFSVEIGGSDYYELARTPDSMAAGSYEVSCQADVATYAGPRATLMESNGIFGLTGVVLGVLLLLLAFVLLLVAIGLALRGRSKNKKNAQYAPTQGGYAQSGYTSPYASPAPGPQGEDTSSYNQPPSSGYGAVPNPYGDAAANSQTYGSPAFPPPPQQSAPQPQDDPYGPPPSAYGTDPTEPVSDATQQIPQGNNSWATSVPDGNEPAPQAPENEQHDDPSEVEDDQQNDPEQTRDDELQDPHQQSGNGYGSPPDDDDKPGQGLGYGGSWPPPPPPSNS